MVHDILTHPAGTLTAEQLTFIETFGYLKLPGALESNCRGGGAVRSLSVTRLRLISLCARVRVCLISHR